MEVSLSVANPDITGTRWTLGILEGGFFPGVAYYFSWYVPFVVCRVWVRLYNFHTFSWYKRSEFGFRLAIFQSATTVSTQYLL